MSRPPISCLLALLAGWACGCASGTGEDSAYTSAQSRPAHGAEPAAANHFDADIDTLERVMGWTLLDMHWGQARIVNEVTALHASAVTDVGHVVDIRAQLAAKGGVDVQVKVGNFGDPAQEKEFLRVLGGRIEKWQKAHPAARRG